ncbi:MAG: InlB B-repeat-containing protein [Anaerovoracaceae bacterium]|nr:InlB B-repeat-containing protein [Anaerovoracaceae bacterium]
MRKWILSIMFAICMVILFMPQAAFAANDDTTNLQEQLNKGGTVALTKDYFIDSTLMVNKSSVTLDLNGHVIKKSDSGSGSVIRVDNGASLTLQDSSPAAAHDGLPCGGVLTGGIITVADNVTPKLQDGGGGVNVASGSFTMNGGTIYGCTAPYGGGVNVFQGSFTMNGGNIYCCTADDGGGVYINNNSMFNYDFKMTGGVIENCAASSSGDAVSTNAMATFLADGGTIIGTVALGGEAKIESGNSSCTRFYGAVENVARYTSVTISGGIYYGGIPSRVNTEGNYKTVRFDLNGGEGYIPDQWFFNDITAMILSPANPTKEGYQSFDGWWYNGYTGYTKYNFTQPVTGNITLTAKYSNPKNYNISYTLNGGTAANPESYTVESDTIKLNNPTKLGYTFTGWSGTDLNGADNMTVTIPKGSTGARSYTANWTRDTYGITYELNGGTAATPQNPTSYTAESETITLNNPEKPGYTFTGWCGTGLSGTNNMTVTIPKGSTGARTYTANWTRDTSGITYELNGGTATNPTSYTAESETITLNNPTRTGYTFTGWSGTDITGENSMTVTISKGSIGARSYTANWTRDTYGITYNLNDGEVPNSQNPTSYTVESDTIKLNNPTKHGYIFNGWSGTGLIGEDNMTVTIPKGSTGNREYTAHWTQDTYEITYHLNDGEAPNSQNPTSYTVESEAIELNNPTKPGYTFTGWNGTGINGRDLKYVIIPNGSTGNREYAADWTPEIYVVTLNTNGGKINSGNVTDYTYGQGATLPTDVTKAGYTFKGWYDNETFTGNPVATISDTDTEKKEYWAKWAAISYPSISQKPAIEAGEGVKVTLSADGTVATITFDDGYELTDVVLNGVSKGKVTEINGLKTGDKLVVTAAKKETEPTDPAKAEILAKLSVQKLAVRSELVTMKNGKKAVKITWHNEDGKMMDFDGVEIYRSTKRNSGYGKKPLYTTTKNAYYNTAIKSGTRYYYKVRGFVTIDGQKYYTDWSTKAWRTVK